MAGMYREKALAKLQSPDQIDQVLTVVRRRNWIPIAILGGLVAAAVMWSMVGRVPVTAEGHGILLTPATIIPFQASVSGQLTQWHVKVGDLVEKGQALADLDQPELTKELQQASSRLQETQASLAALADLKESAYQLEKTALRRKRTALGERIKLLNEQITTSRRLADDLRVRNQDYLGKHRENLSKTRSEVAALGQEITGRAESYQKLRAEGLSSDDQVLNARRNDLENRLRLADLDLKLQELILNESQAQESYIETLNRLDSQANTVTDLTLQLKQLDISEVQLDKGHNQARLVDEGQVNDLKRAVAKLDEQLNRSRVIKSEVGGRILELTVTEGNLISAGRRLGTIDTRGESAELECLAYFKVKDGKKIKPGMKVRITPDTVQRERYGSLLGTVVSVSGYPVTAAGAANFVGNGDVAQKLTEEEHQIEVFARLDRDPDTISGYSWTSRGGPPLKITAGTTCSPRVTIEDRAPITFVIPILREWSGF